jgi:uncharacterized membrane protein HdeD (DUF308 family)
MPVPVAKQAKMTLVDTDGVLTATVEEVTTVAAIIGGITDVFSTTVAHVGSGALIGKAALIAGAVYGTAYLKDGEFNFNPFG